MSNDELPRLFRRAASLGFFFDVVITAVDVDSTAGQGTAFADDGLDGTLDEIWMVEVIGRDFSSAHRAPVPDAGQGDPLHAQEAKDVPALELKDWLEKAEINCVSREFFMHR